MRKRKLGVLPDLPGEEWRPVPSLSGRVEVSSFGRARRAVTTQGSGFKGEHYRVGPQHQGYLAMGVCINGRHKTLPIHRLVLEAFIGPRPEGTEGAHLNGDRTDARLVNLAYVTPKENQRHRHLHGTALVGEDCPWTRLTAADVLAIRASKPYARPGIAAAYGVSASMVSRIRRGVAWRHLLPEGIVQ